MRIGDRTRTRTRRRPRRQAGRRRAGRAGKRRRALRQASPPAGDRPAGTALRQAGRRSDKQALRQAGGQAGGQAGMAHGQAGRRHPCYSHRSPLTRSPSSGRVHKLYIYRKKHVGYFYIYRRNSYRPMTSVAYARRISSIILVIAASTLAATMTVAMRHGWTLTR